MALYWLTIETVKYASLASLLLIYPMTRHKVGDRSRRLRWVANQSADKGALDWYTRESGNVRNLKEVTVDANCLVTSRGPCDRMKWSFWAFVCVICVCIERRVSWSWWHHPRIYSQPPNSCPASTVIFPFFIVLNHYCRSSRVMFG